MNYVGLDLSLTNSGYILVNESGVKEHGVIKSSKRGIARLKDIYEEIVYFIRNNCYTAKHNNYADDKICKFICNEKVIVAIEGYAFSPNQGRSFSLGELGGIIKFFLYVNNICYYIVAPTTLKKFATGNGRAQKSDIAKEVYKRWSIEFETEHEVDAFVLAKIAYYLNTGKVDKLTKKQLEALKVVKDDKGDNNFRG